MATGATDSGTAGMSVMQQLVPLMSLFVKTYFRAEVRGEQHIPDDGVLIVSNHSGGTFSVDMPMVATAFADRFGAPRNVHTIAHDVMFLGPFGPVMRAFGLVPGSREGAVEILRSGESLLVFPGGDRDAMRPTRDGAKIDFYGRQGYIRTALEAGVKILPVVTIGGQETQLYLNDGTGLARFLRFDKMFRTKSAPLTLGFPFGLTPSLPPNLPLPSKLVTEILEPIDIEAEFGRDPDIEQVDEMVRKRMQHALDGLARERRFPVLG
ncbi:lysophospholipid acyltransferase family protein [Gordonia rhizosphera]|uniref:Putative acyltransferase n=1 Tax=Gordonia rhizosphera NBRC 16068 TaxID=1108045 RepID=K6WFV3_9ACTN|nr:lysophospholipid acyltransferase family protein [Gordonia rhizosphera]GAB92651.1 putative acyltransferase [Gordonia rhizosphera NBRC 16068]